MTGRKKLLMAFAFLGLLFAMQPQARADGVWIALGNPQSDTGFAYRDSSGDSLLDPYNVVITGGSVTTSLALSCDDFTGALVPPTVWSATANDLVSLSASGWTLQKFQSDQTYGTTDTYSVAEQYYAAAVLASFIFQQYGNWIDDVTSATPDPAVIANDQAIDAKYTYALWTLFDPDLLNDDLVTPTGAKDLMLSTLADIRSGATPTVPDVVVYTPADPNVQELIGPSLPGADPVKITLPEASAVPFLPFDLFALFGGIFLVRKRILAN